MKKIENNMTNTQQSEDEERLFNRENDMIDNKTIKTHKPFESIQFNTSHIPFNKTVFNMQYKRLGNLYAFSFNSNGYPRIIIGESWIPSIIVISILFFGGIALYVFLLKTLFTPFLKVSYIIIASILLSTFSWSSFSNPGIVLNQKGHSKDNNDYTCEICQISTLDTFKIKHCSQCNVCIQNRGHHCSFFTKCIGQNNKIIFYVFATFIPILYFDIIGGLIYIIGFKRVVTIVFFPLASIFSLK